MQYSFYCQKTLLCLRQINFLKYNTERMFLSIIGTVPDLILIVSNPDPILIRTLFYFLIHYRQIVSGMNCIIF